MVERLTPEEIDYVLERLRQGAVVQTDGEGDWYRYSYADGQWIEDGFDQGRSWHYVRTEEFMRHVVATTRAFRRVLPREA